MNKRIIILATVFILSVPAIIIGASQFGFMESPPQFDARQQAVVTNLPIFEQQEVRNGMTWGIIKPAWWKKILFSFKKTVLVSCHGEPPVNMSSASCDAYHGETSCRTMLPVLCISKQNLPSGISDSDIRQYQGYYQWSGAEIRVSPAVEARRLTSREAADKFCADLFGTGWRMAEHHDAGNWGFWAKGSIPDSSRFWVAINDQPANCWDNKTAKVSGSWGR